MICMGYDACSTKAHCIHVILQCMNCCGNVTVGVYWQCTECPEGSETRLCTDCVNRYCHRNGATGRSVHLSIGF